MRQTRHRFPLDSGRSPRDPDSPPICPLFWPEAVRARLTTNLPLILAEVRETQTHHRSALDSGRRPWELGLPAIWREAAANPFPATLSGNQTNQHSPHLHRRKNRPNAPTLRIIHTTPEISPCIGASTGHSHHHPLATMRTGRRLHLRLHLRFNFPPDRLRNDNRLNPLFNHLNRRPWRRLLRFRNPLLQHCPIDQLQIATRSKIPRLLGKRPARHHEPADSPSAAIAPYNSRTTGTPTCTERHCLHCTRYVSPSLRATRSMPPSGPFAPFSCTA